LAKRQLMGAEKLVDEYLEKNPKVKEALGLFNISKQQYSDSVKAKMPSYVHTSSQTDTNNGNLAGNQPGHSNPRL
jgi:hypothetical protein